MLNYIGTTIAVLTVILSSYFLLIEDIDVARVITFAVIGLFSGIIMLLRDRITSIKLPVLGEVVAKAREDASEITNIRKDVQVQSESIKEVLKQAADLQEEIGELTEKLASQKINARKKILQERISELNATIDERRRLSRNKILNDGFPKTSKESHDRFMTDSATRKLEFQRAEYYKELEKLEEEGQVSEDEQSD